MHTVDSQPSLTPINTNEIKEKEKGILWLTFMCKVLNILARFCPHQCSVILLWLMPDDFTPSLKKDVCIVKALGGVGENENKRVSRYDTESWLNAMYSSCIVLIKKFASCDIFFVSRKCEKGEPAVKARPSFNIRYLDFRKTQNTRFLQVLQHPACLDHSIQTWKPSSHFLKVGFANAGITLSKNKRKNQDSKSPVRPSIW